MLTSGPKSRSSLAATLDGLGHVLRDSPLVVPQYQRGYAWRQEEVGLFWDDLRASMAAAQPEYFIGTVVLSRSQGDRRAVIDGQQRLATVTLLYGAIRDEFLSRGDDNRATVIESGYLSYRSLRTGEVEPRLRLGEDDDSFFWPYVQGLSPAQQRPSHRRIAEAATYLRHQLHSDLEASGANWDQRLLRWVDFLDEELRVIVVSVPSDEDAFLFFETLNDRGIQLSTSDLLKNYLYSLAGDLLSGIEDAWTTSVRSLEAYADESLYTNFVRQYWSSMHGATRERSLYREIRRHVRGPKDALGLALGLQGAAPRYAALLDATHDYWKTPQFVQPELVLSLLRLRLEQHRPLLLAGLEVLSEHERVRLLENVLNWGVRGLVVGGIGGGTSERYYADAAVELRRGGIRHANELKGVLGRVAPTDREFLASFERLSPTKVYLAKYFLIALNEDRDGASANLVGADEERAWIVQQCLSVEEFAAEDRIPVEDARVIARRLANFVVVPSANVAGFRELPIQDRVGLLRVARAPGRGFASLGDLVAARQSRLAERAVSVWPRQVA